MNFKKMVLSILFGATVFSSVLFVCPVITYAAEPISATASELETGEETATDEDVGEETENDENNDDTEAETVDFKEVLVAYLKAEYGEEYQKYYDLIIEEWGSAKAYIESVLNNAVEDGKMTEESATAWKKFIDWLHEYTVIWVPVAAVGVLIVCGVLGKKAVTAVKGLFSKIFKGNNQTASALITALNAIEVLLGNTSKTEDVRAQIEKAKEELEKDV